MVWVVVGIFAGLLAAFVAFGLALAINELSHLIDESIGGCETRSWFVDLWNGFACIAILIAVGILLVLSRKSVVRRVEPRYGEFAADVGSWFSFGSVLTYVVCGVPLVGLAIFNMPCS